MALAADAEFYTPPAAVASFARRGALLPLWWSNPGDAVLAPETPEWWQRDVKERFQLKGEIVNDGVPADDLDPWGWSKDVINRLGSVVPASGGVDTTAIKALSHRRTATEILRELGCSRLPQECTTLDGALRCIDRLGGEAVIKTPWSCSSRGVRKVSELSQSSLCKFINASLQRTGCIMVEPLYNKTLDFAALFRSSGGKVSCTGWSIFKTDGKGFYTGNVVASQTEIAKEIPEEAKTHIPKLEKVLTDIIGDRYRGMLGIDMLQRIDGEVHPCVELNLRRTMGHVAMDVFHKTGITGLLNAEQHDTEPLVRITPDLFRLDPL